MSDIKTIVESIKSGQKTATEVVTKALDLADQLNPKYNIFINIPRERALERAAQIDQQIKNDKPVGELAGVPFIIKDNMLAFGAPTTAGSHFLEKFEAPIQAEAVERLERAGAIVVGKANLDAFAHGGSTENSAFGVTKNAADPTLVAGGSSGGSAVGVALDIAPIALGSDTGGSIRQPASFNGVVGIKPTYGLVSRFGVVAMASSTDVIGCFTKTAEDVDLVMRILAGQDAKDMNTYASDYQSAELPKSTKIGMVKQFMENLEPEVAASIEASITDLKALGHQVEEVDLPEAKHALAIYYIVAPAEVSSNLARYDGVRYGTQYQQAEDLDQLYKMSRAWGFEAENKRRIMIGSYVLSSGYFDAYYLQAQKVRTLLIDKFKQLFADYDYLIGPVVPEPAFKIGERTHDPIKMYMSDILTTPASMAGLPAVSLPVNPTAAGLPIGLQIIGPMRADAEVMALAKQLETYRQGDK